MVRWRNFCKVLETFCGDCRTSSLIKASSSFQAFESSGMNMLKWFVTYFLVGTDYTTWWVMRWRVVYKNWNVSVTLSIYHNGTSHPFRIYLCQQDIDRWPYCELRCLSSWLCWHTNSGFLALWGRAPLLCAGSKFRDRFCVPQENIPRWLQQCCRVFYLEVPHIHSVYIYYRLLRTPRMNMR